MAAQTHRLTCFRKCPELGGENSQVLRYLLLTQLYHPGLISADDTPIVKSNTGKVHILDIFRTPDRVLGKLGLGKEAGMIRKQWVGHKQQLPKELDKVNQWYQRVGKSDEASQKLFKYLDGDKSVKLNQTELEVAGEIRGYLKQWADRLGRDRMTANQVADIAYSAVHNTKSKVLSTKQPRIKVLIKPKGKIANSAFMAEFDRSGLIKSVYPKELRKLQKGSRGGRGTPPSGALRLNPAAPISDIQEPIAIIPPKVKRGAYIPPLPVVS